MSKNVESIASVKRMPGNEGVLLYYSEGQVNCMRKLLTWYANSDIVQPEFNADAYGWMGVEGDIRRKALLESLREDQEAFLDLMEEAFGNWFDKKDTISQLGLNIIHYFGLIDTHLNTGYLAKNEIGFDKLLISHLNMYVYCVTLFLMNVCHFLDIDEQSDYQKFLIQYQGENIERTRELFKIEE